MGYRQSLEQSDLDKQSDTLTGCVARLRLIKKRQDAVSSLEEKASRRNVLSSTLFESSLAQVPSMSPDMSRNRASNYSSVPHSEKEDVERLSSEMSDCGIEESLTDPFMLRNDRCEVASSRPSTFKIDARVISDAIIGLSDGLTVPFALTAGLSGLGDTKVVIYGGLAELTAGAISMGLGGYLGAKSEEESYKSTLTSTENQVVSIPQSVSTSVTEIFEPYDLPESLLADLSAHIQQSSKATDFIMHFEHNLPPPSSSRAITCAITITSGYFIGGFIPLVPYFFVKVTDVYLGLLWSVVIMAIALFTFGYTKTCFVSGWSGRKAVFKGVIGGLQMMLVGSIAAGAAMGLVKLFQVR